MNRSARSTIVIIALMILSFTASTRSQRYMEKLDRGIIAINQGGGAVYISWRMLGTDPNDIAFNLYRSTDCEPAVKLNDQPITQSTNYVDYRVSMSRSHRYYVRPVINGQEWGSSEVVEIMDEQYLTVPLQIPPGPYVTSSGYTPGDASVGDLDGDDKYEIVLKWEDNPQDNAHDGFTNSPILDAYELDGTLIWRIDLGINIREGAHYTQFMVYDLDSDGKAEVACKTADGTVDGLGKVIGNPNADWRNDYGYILEGPEFLTIFDGQTGAELITTDYIPPRGNVCDWGDCYGNRVDRFLACIAYLDGVRPSLVMCRGYYTSRDGTKGRTVLAAWDWRNGQLTQRWTFDANPSMNRTYLGQGNHNLSVADVDGDGKDEIVYGACCIDDDGTGLYTTGLGHGDAMHLSDMDPNRPGLEVFDIHEPVHEVGAEFRDAGTGELIWAKPTSPSSDEGPGRALAADITTIYKGYECWVAGGGLSDNLWNCYGQRIGGAPASCNFAIWWDGDLLRELLDSNRIDKYGASRLLTAYGCSSINGTKSTPCLQADLLGDWREEVIWKTSDNCHLRIYTTTIPTDHRIYTLMHDPVYRLSVAWQNVAYNQPPHTGFYLGDGMAVPLQPQIRIAVPPSYGDFTGDGSVNIDDLPKFCEIWLENDCNQISGLDLNGDCIIDFCEFSILAQNWLEGFNEPHVPNRRF
jgi:rhamnogalacturonan endolyase